MDLKTILNYLKSSFRNDVTLKEYVKWVYVGGDIIDYLVSMKRFPFIVLDRAEGTGEEYITSGIKDCREHHFNLTVKIGVRRRNKQSALIGDEGLLDLTEDVMSVLFADPKLSLQVHKMDENITINEADIAYKGQYIGLGREIAISYSITE